VDDLYAKIVERNRGGFCYELNGLFAELLRALGYRVDLLSGSVRRKDGSFGAPGEHLTLLVHLDQPYLTEVGFSLSFPRVMTLDGTPHAHPKGTYRVRKMEEPVGAEEYIIEREQVEGNSSEWIPEFRFDPTPHPLSYFKPICREVEPIFSAKWFCNIGTPDGSYMLKENEFVSRIGENETRKPVDSMEEFWKLMHTSCEPFRLVAESVGK
jgi:N-hydroxyarylamine O-acetyltransferase